MLFIKASKILAFATVFAPLTGCAIGTGLIYSALVRGCAYAPEMEETMFNYATLGFAFVETFAFMLLGAAAAVLVI